MAMESDAIGEKAQPRRGALEVSLGDRAGGKAGRKVPKAESLSFSASLETRHGAAAPRSGLFLVNGDRIAPSKAVGTGSSEAPGCVGP